MNQTRIDLAIDSLLAENPVEALGHLMLYKVEAAAEVKRAAEGARKVFEEARDRPVMSDSLPPITPLKPGRVNAREVSCPTCKVKAGRKCVKMTTRGPHGKPTDEPLTNSAGEPANHRKRLEKAKEARNA